MSGLVRFGVSIDKSLLEQFDLLIEGKNYTNRSEAFRDMIRQELVRKELDDDQEVAGAITFVFDHHRRALLNRITDLQHDHQALIISTQHVHLDHDHCLEIVAVRGKARSVQELADHLKAVKGVDHCLLSVTSTQAKGR